MWWATYLSEIKLDWPPFYILTQASLTLSRDFNRRQYTSEQMWKCRCRNLTQQHKAVVGDTQVNIFSCFPFLILSICLIFFLILRITKLWNSYQVGWYKYRSSASVSFEFLLKSCEVTFLCIGNKWQITLYTVSACLNADTGINKQVKFLFNSSHHNACELKTPNQLLCLCDSLR